MGDSVDRRVLLRKLGPQGRCRVVAAAAVVLTAVAQEMAAMVPWVWLSFFTNEENLCFSFIAFEAINKYPLELS